MGEFRMPSLGADMDVGTIIEWLVQPGDPVTRGQIVAVVDTAKAAIEIEAFETGVLEKILVGPGTQVPVGTPLALIGAAVPATAEPIGTPEESVLAGVGAATTPEPTALTPVVPEAGLEPEAPLVLPGAGATATAGPEPTRPAPAGPLGGPPRATPPVRHLAHQLGVDLDAVWGSGPGGQVTHDDVLRASSAGATAAPPEAASASQVAAPPARRADKPPRLPSPEATHAPGQPTGLRPGASPEGARLRATPRARRIAAERGIDLDAVVGTGSEGAVLAADVQRAAVRPRPAAAPPTPLPSALPPVGPLSAEQAPSAHPTAPATAGHPERKAAMRTAIASLMSRSNAEIPHYYVTQTMDLGRALTWLHAHNATLPPDRRLLPAVLFLRAAVLAAQAVPDLNGHWVSGELHPVEQVDLGVAIATRGGGLVTPAITDAAELQIDALMARLADLVRRARRGTLKRAELAGASITVSSLGESGPDALYGVIFPPQVALVGVGGIVDRPWAVDGMLTVRPTATVVLAADHRASDGRTASAFLAAFAHALDHPEEM